MKTSPLHKSLIAVIGLSSVSFTQAAVPFSDNFTSAHNYAGGNVSGTGWDGVLNSGSLTAGTAGGGILSWNTTGVIDNGATTAAFLYLNVSGDFSATVRANDISGSFQVGGILALDPTSSLPSNADWAFVDHHVFGSNVFFNSVNGVVPGGGNPSITFGGTAGEYLKLDRTGTLFTASAKLNIGDSWTTIASVNRADIPNNLRVGLTVSSSGGAGGLYEFSNFSVVPEPGSAMLVMAGAGMLAMRRKRNA